MEPRYRRPSSPGSRRLANPLRSSTGSVGYSSPYDPYYAGPRSSLRDVAPTSRGGVQPIGGVERISVDTGRSVPRTIQREVPKASQPRLDSGTRPRRATLDRDNDGGRRPPNPMPPPSATSLTRPIIHTSTLPSANRPSSPLARRRQSTDDEDYYVQPASSGRRSQHRRIYSLDSNDIDRGVRERDSQVAQVPSDSIERGGYRSSGLGGGRRGYNLKAPLVRRADPENDDYGYSYTNPKEQMYRDTAPRPRPRGNSYSTQRRERPLSMTGMEDYLPRVPNNRDAGPPPTTRQFDRLGGVGRSSSLKQSPRSGVDDRLRIYPSSRDTDAYDESPSRQAATKPVFIHHVRDNGYESDSEDYDHPDRREKHDRRARRYDDEVSTRGFGVRVPDVDRNRARIEDVDRYDTQYKEPRFAEAPPKVINNELPRKVDRQERAPQVSDSKDKDYIAEDLRNHDRRNWDTRNADVRGQGLSEEEFRDMELRDRRKREVQELKESYKGPREDEYPEAERRRKERRHKEYSDDEFETDEDDRRDRERRRRLRRERKALERDALNSDPRDVNSRDTSGQGPDHADTGDYGENGHRHRDHYDRESDRESHARDSQVRDHGRRETREKESYERLLDNDEPLVGEPDAVTPERPSRVRVVSPSGGKEPEQPVKGILRPPREKFPEDPAPMREGVAPLKDAGKKGIPPGARWTKVDRKLVNPAALEEAQERFEERLDYVIVLRVLTKEEIQEFAARTQEIRDERYAQEKRDRHRHRDEPRAIEDSQPAPKAIEAPADLRRPTIVEPPPSRTETNTLDENFRENPDAPGTYMGYRRNPPPPRQPQQ
ncbi:MAG: hypothetical protein M1836_006032 [Candelina mexicana]|nr:MAG: hypothetical protein M1836_006032 [Candelina mexicana]